MKILIVKLSSLGDVVHAMPAVQDIRRALPLAQIDWVVERGFAPLVQACEGVHRVIPCELRRWRKAPFSAATRSEWKAFMAELQAEAYDAVLDLQGLSKSALLAWLSRMTPQGKRYALANRTEGSSYEAPTRWVADVAIAIGPRTHAVRRSRELCARALGYELPPAEHYGLQAGARPASVPQTRRPCVALVHGSSRADKQWPQTHWAELALRLDVAGFDVALLHGSDEEQERCEAMARHMSKAVIWPRLGLDDMCAALTACAGVIGVDSGLSHMAVALDLPHVQIYNFDTAWRTGPVGLARQRSIHATPTPSVEVVWQTWLAVAPTVAHA